MRTPKRTPKQFCTVDGCERVIEARGLCNLHYQRMMGHGSTDSAARVRGTCSLEGCSNPHYGRGMCRLHWRRWDAHGDPNKVDHGGRRVPRLEQSLAFQFPDVAVEWHARNIKKPDTVFAKSNATVWWICLKNHEWQAKICNRTSLKTCCPYCAGRSTEESQSIAATRPDLIRDWHPTRNGKLQPSTLGSGSGLCVWWLCSRCKNEWRGRIRERSVRGHGCPNCKESGTSSPEKRLYVELLAGTRNALPKTIAKPPRYRPPDG